MKKQIQVFGADVSTARLQVAQVLQSAAAQFGLFDNTDTSRISNTIISIVEQEGFGFGLGARIVNDQVVVDFNFRTNTDGKLDEIYADILKNLSSKPFQRLEEVSEGKSQYIPFPAKTSDK